MVDTDDHSCSLLFSKKAFFILFHRINIVSPFASCTTEVSAHCRKMDDQLKLERDILHLAETDEIAVNCQ